MLHICSGVTTVLILQQPECSTLCEFLQSLLGTAAVPAGSVQEKRIGIPNLNLIILFQQVPVEVRWACAAHLPALMEQYGLSPALPVACGRSCPRWCLLPGVVVALS